MTRKFSIRKRIDDYGAEVDEQALLDAWNDGLLTTEDELKSILERVYYSHEDPKYRESCKFISDAAAMIKKNDKKKRTATYKKLRADLELALNVAFNHGASKFVMDNYPTFKPVRPKSTYMSMQEGLDVRAEIIKSPTI